MHVIEKWGTSMYQNSFTVPDYLSYTEHPYFQFQIKDYHLEEITTLNVLLVTYPGIRSHRGLWTKRKGFPNRTDRENSRPRT